MQIRLPAHPRAGFLWEAAAFNLTVSVGKYQMEGKRRAFQGEAEAHAGPRGHDHSVLHRMCCGEWDV